MLPTSADFMNGFRGIRDTCTGWELKENRELMIPRGSLIGQFSSGNATEYQMADETIVGGDPNKTVKAYLSKKGIDVNYVRFVVIGYQPPYSRLLNDDSERTGIRGFILVTLSEDAHRDACRWYKVGMFVERNFRRELLEHDIIAAAA